MPFKDNFLWGVASSALQIEGAYQEEGKGLGIWDLLAKDKIKNGENADVSINHYYKYKSDISLMKKLGVKHYRFSISWPRILPDGIGKVNEAGIKFYIDLVNELLGAGIEPMVTLYHWDYPKALFDLGGWKHEDSPRWFEEYTKTVVQALSGKVKYWITFNEPQMFVGQGYVTGEHAPFESIRDPHEIMNISKHVMLAHGMSVKVIREYSSCEVNIGFSPVGSSYTPLNNSEAEIEIARKKTFDSNNIVFGNRWWSDPIVLGIFPEEIWSPLGITAPPLTEDELAVICQPIDFYGFNVYESMNAHEKDKRVPGTAQTSLGTQITPEVMYWSSKFFYERYQLPLLITENGMSNLDNLMLDGKIHDPQRIDYIHRYLKELKKAINDGIPVLGYTYWSIFDNFEWVEGYDPKFGLIFIDYQSLDRIPKDSAQWYAEVIRTNGKNI